MKRITYIILALTIVMASCKKDLNQPETLDAPATIVFNDNIDLVTKSFPTGTPKGSGEVALKITTSENIKQLKFTTRLSGVDYAQGTVAVPAGGVYNFSRLVKDLRGPTSPILPEGTSSSVAVTLIVEGILADGTSVRRIFTITVTAS